MTGAHIHRPSAPPQMSAPAPPPPPPPPTMPRPPAAAVAQPPNVEGLLEGLGNMMVEGQGPAIIEKGVRWDKWQWEDGKKAWRKRIFDLPRGLVKQISEYIVSQGRVTGDGYRFLQMFAGYGDQNREMTFEELLCWVYPSPKARNEMGGMFDIWCAQRQARVRVLEEMYITRTWVHHYWDRKHAMDEYSKMVDKNYRRWMNDPAVAEHEEKQECVLEMKILWRKMCRWPRIFEKPKCYKLPQDVIKNIIEFLCYEGRTDWDFAAPRQLSIFIPLGTQPKKMTMEEMLNWLDPVPKAQEEMDWIERGLRRMAIYREAGCMVVEQALEMGRNLQAWGWAAGELVETFWACMEDPNVQAIEWCVWSEQWEMEKRYRKWLRGRVREGRGRYRKVGRRRQQGPHRHRRRRYRAQRAKRG